jgi:hypothetical protein
VATLGPTPDQDRALSTLVENGTLTADQAASVKAVLWTPSTKRVVNPTSVLIEVAGYLGGGLMLGGAALLLAVNWERMSERDTVSILIGYAVALVVAGILVAGGPHRIIGLRRGEAPVRRRLVSVLFALSAGPAAMAAGVAADSEEVLAAGLVGFVVAVAGYALLPTVPGMLMTAAMSALAVGGGIEAVDRPPDLLVTYAYVGLGLAWGVVAAIGLVQPRHIGYAIGAGITIVGAQLALGPDREPVAYGLTFGAAVLCFLVYWLERATALLAFGVVAATIAVPEAVSHLTNDALSGPYILLLTGAVLVAASALGLWVRAARRNITAAP